MIVNAHTWNRSRTPENNVINEDFSVDPLIDNVCAKANKSKDIDKMFYFSFQWHKFFSKEPPSVERICAHRQWNQVPANETGVTNKESLDVHWYSLNPHEIDHMITLIRDDTTMVNANGGHPLRCAWLLVSSSLQQHPHEFDITGLTGLMASPERCTEAEGCLAALVASTTLGDIMSVLKST